MNNIDKVIVGGMVVTSVLAASYGVASADQLGSYVTAQRLNMRKGPSTSYISVGVLPSDSKVEVLEVSSDGLWGKIKFQSQEVWLNMQYLKRESQKPQQPSTSTIKLNSNYKVTAGINMRKGPSTDYSKVGYAPIGTIVVPISEDNGWVKIKYEGKEGWISAQYLEEQKTSTEQGTVQQAPNKVEIGEKYKTTIALNARKGPGTTYEVVLTLKQGQEVLPLNLEKNGYWAKIKHNGEIMYVCTTYLEKADEAQKPETPTKPQADNTKYKVTAALNVRKGPSTDYERVGLVSMGTVVEPKEFTSDKKWAKIDINGREGWISASYLEEYKGSSGESTQEEAPNKVEIGEKYKTKVALNARKGPANTYEIILTLKQGQEVLPLSLEKNGYWAKIKHNGEIMYVCTTYLEKVQETQKPVVTPVQNPDSNTYFYTTVNLNMREGAKTTYKRICVIPANTKIKVLEYSNDGLWAKVEYNGKTGWIVKEYIKEATQPTASESQNKKGTTKFNLNIRKGPSTDFDIVATIPMGSKIDITQEVNGWVKVKYKSYEGYCSSQFVER